MMIFNLLLRVLPFSLKFEAYLKIYDIIKAFVVASIFEEIDDLLEKLNCREAETCVHLHLCVPVMFYMITKGLS